VKTVTAGIFGDTSYLEMSKPALKLVILNDSGFIQHMISLIQHFFNGIFNQAVLAWGSGDGSLCRKFSVEILLSETLPRGLCGE